VTRMFKSAFKVEWRTYDLETGTRSGWTGSVWDKREDAEKIYRERVNDFRGQGFELRLVEVEYHSESNWRILSYYTNIKALK
jgi:hypothetical protein